MFAHLTRFPFLDCHCRTNQGKGSHFHVAVWIEVNPMHEHVGFSVWSSIHFLNSIFQASLQIPLLIFKTLSGLRDNRLSTLLLK